MQPAVLDAAILEKLISAAVAAPSMHNTQPWRYRLNPDTVTLEVRAAPERALREADPMGRAMSVSAGAAVFNLRVAVAHFGWEPVVRLLPHRSQPDLLATVRLAASSRARPHPAHDELYDVIWRRHSSRLPFTGRRLPRQLLYLLADAAREDGAGLHLAGPEETSHLLRLTAEAEQRNTHDPRRVSESREWLRDSGPYGIPAAAVGPQDSAHRMPVRDFRAAGTGARQPTALFESRPTLAVLTTGHDRRADWLRAGQALEHVLLLATSHAVRASLLHQALEWSDLRWALNDGRRTPGHVQMLIRLGYGPAGPATPRSGAHDALDGGPAGPGGTAAGR
ncbi:Acg family FMN-binding oxidoreductase [Streptomyces cucumeris]|uniref:Acg family FMN-binding oxidoreductase n=1 Tax=Streptomyces cucumeris TaxID=2962890 RepID=UPI003D7317A3